MAEMTSADQAKLQCSNFFTPQYQISYGNDQTLQWTPSVGSKELAVALSYHFPLQKDLESKMQAAMKLFLHQEQQNQSHETDQVMAPFIGDSTMHHQLSAPPTDPSVTSSPDSGPVLAAALQIVTWDSKMKEFNPRIRKRRYEKDERAKVAANRGFACERHRRQKMKCDPERCAQNKQRLNGQEAFDVAPKPEDELLTEEFLAGQLTSEYDAPPETLHPMPMQPDELSLRSFTPSDPSVRWSWSSFVDPTNSFSGNFYRSEQHMDLSTPSLSLANSSKCHDSIGSIFSETGDLDFLANYDPITSTFSHDKTNVEWQRDDSRMEDGDFLHDPFFPAENAIPFPTAYGAPGTFASSSSNASAFEPSVPWKLVDCSQGRDDMITASAIPEAPLDCAGLMPCATESLAEPAHILPHEDEASMGLRPSQKTIATPGGSTHDQEIIPLTDVQRETLIKWWGKDRFTEQPQNLCSRSSLEEDRTSSSVHTDTSGVEAGLGGKNPSISKVKGTQIPPPFRKGLWRSSSSGKEKK